MNQQDNLQVQQPEPIRLEIANLKTPSRNSFDESFAGMPSNRLDQDPGYRSPGKVIAFIHKNQDEQMNFKKWILSLVSIGNMIMSPMIVLMGFQASSYGLSKVEADKALIIMGIFIFFLSLCTVIATIKLHKRTLFFILYAFIVLFVFISIFTLGIFSFKPDIEQWVYGNWGHIRSVTDRFNYEQFEKDIKNDILSLGVFSITIMVSIIIGIVAIIQLLGYHIIRKRILPLLSLLIVILSSALIIISMYARKSASYVNLPTWVNATAIAIGLFLMGVGAFGYYASIRRIRKLLAIYLGILVITFGFMLYVTFGYFSLSSTFQQLVEKDWPEIYTNLLERGYNVTKVTFMDYVMMNLKFAGLYGLMYSCFVFIAILSTISKIHLLSHPPL